MERCFRGAGRESLGRWEKTAGAILRLAGGVKKNTCEYCSTAFLAVAMPFVVSFLVGCQTPTAIGPEFSLLEVPPEKSLVYVYNPHVGFGDAPFYICHARSLAPGEMPEGQEEHVLIDPVSAPAPEGWRPGSVEFFTAARFYDIKALRQGQSYNVIDIAREVVTGGMYPTDTTMVIRPYIGRFAGPPYVFRTVDRDTLGNDLSLAAEHPDVRARAVTVVPDFLQWRGYSVLELEPGTGHFFVTEKRGGPRGNTIRPAYNELDRMITIDLKPGHRYFVKIRRGPDRFQQVTERQAMRPNSFMQVRPLGILDCRLITD